MELWFNSSAIWRKGFITLPQLSFRTLCFKITFYKMSLWLNKINNQINLHYAELTGAHMYVCKNHTRVK